MAIAKNLRIACWGSLAVTILSGLCDSALAEPLLLSTVQGRAPLTVRVIGPNPVLERAERCHNDRTGWLGRGGNLFSVDWGDGSDRLPFQYEENGRCTEWQLTRTLSAPGVYRVVAIQGTSEGGPVRRWEATVRVIGDEGPSSVQIIDPTAGVVFADDELVLTSLKLRALQRVDLEMVLERRDGMVVASRSHKQLAFDGTFESFLLPHKRGWPAVRRSVKKGDLRLFLKVRLLANGKALQPVQTVPILIRRADRAPR